MPPILNIFYLHYLYPIFWRRFELFFSFPLLDSLVWAKNDFCLLIWCYLPLFLNIKPALHSWYKSHLVMMCNPFMLLGLVYWYFVEESCIFIQKRLIIRSFLIMSILFGSDIVVTWLIEWVGKASAMAH